MSGFSYPRTVANRPILDLSIRSELERNIANLESTLFAPKSLLETKYTPIDYTRLFSWEKAWESREEVDAIEIKYHRPDPIAHMDVIKHQYFKNTHKHTRVDHIRILRPPGITSDTLTDIIKNWTGRRKIRVPLP